jgi:hypothetical protein
MYIHCCGVGGGMDGEGGYVDMGLEGSVGLRLLLYQQMGWAGDAWRWVGVGGGGWGLGGGEGVTRKGVPTRCLLRLQQQ